MLWGARCAARTPRARLHGDRHRRGARRARRPRGAHPRGRAGRKTYGVEHGGPARAGLRRVRHQGEPVALVAADHPATARRAAALIELDWSRCRCSTREPRSPRRRRALHPAATSCAHVRIVPRRPGRDGRRRRARRATRSACRTRPSSARSPASRARPATAAWSCRSRRSGCTWTASRSRRPRAPEEQGAAHARRRRRGVRRPRGHLGADPRLPARARAPGGR